MKYIRTKNGKIYEVTASSETNKLYENSNCYRVYDRENLCDKDICITDVISQADTIEELCDMFVCDHNNGTRVIQIKECKPQFPFCEDTIDYFRRNNQKYYGAIWTDKGLIFVARMNERGELELL